LEVEAVVGTRGSGKSRRNLKLSQSQWTWRRETRLNTCLEEGSRVTDH
jgi:hypothetical protein